MRLERRWLVWLENESRDARRLQVEMQRADECAHLLAVCRRLINRVKQELHKSDTVADVCALAEKIGMSDADIRQFTRAFHTRRDSTYRIAGRVMCDEMWRCWMYRHLLKLSQEDFWEAWHKYDSAWLANQKLSRSAKQRLFGRGDSSNQAGAAHTAHEATKQLTPEQVTDMLYELQDELEK